MWSAIRGRPSATPPGAELPGRCRRARARPCALLSRNRELGHGTCATPTHLDVERTAEELGALPRPSHGGLDVGGTVNGSADANLECVLGEADVDLDPRLGLVGEDVDEVLDD